MQKRYILFLVPLILYVVLLPVLPQMEPDEARYSLIASSMNDSGNYVTPHIKGVTYLEKPPLVSWVTAILFKVIGENDFSARLLAALCAWGMILLAYFIGKHFLDEKAGLYAAMLTTISSFHFLLGRLNILDMPLTFIICLAIWQGYLALRNQNKKYLLYLFYLYCAFAFLTKGIIGVVFPFGILIIWLIWTGRWREIWKLFSPIGILIFLIIVCPWLIMAQRENHDFLWYFFVHEHFLRFTTKMHGKTEPFYFFLPVLIAGILPWAVYLIKAWKNKYLQNSFFGKDENKLLVVWSLLIFIFYSISSSKLPTYIAPVFLPLALFAGCIFKRYEEELQAGNVVSRNYIYRIALILQSLILIIVLILPPIFKRYSDAEKGLVIMTSDFWWLYIIIPVITLILMTFLPDIVFKKYKKGWFSTAYVLCAILLASMIFPMKDFLAPYRSAKVTKEAIAKFVPKNEKLYQYRENFYGIDFYNKIRTPIVEDFGELSGNITRLNEKERKQYFLSAADFFNLCAEKKDIYCITQHEAKFRQIKERFPKTEILWDNKAFYLLHIKS